MSLYIDTVPLSKINQFLITLIQEEAQVHIRQEIFFFIDLVRAADSTYRDSAGVAHDMSGVTWSGSNPDYGSQNCISAGSPDFLRYYDLLCGANDNDPYEILCIV